MDISGEAFRQTVIAEGAKNRYEGHPTTLVADDGKTLFCVWTTGHGGPCGQMARSGDGGKTWMRVDSILPVAYARTHRNCPTLQKVKGLDGKTRYFVYSAKAKEGCGLGILMSEDLGESWVELPCQSHLSAGMPPTGLMALKDGAVALFGQVRKDPKVKTDRPADDQAVWMALSKDGGRTYGEMRRVMEAPEKNLCEPCCLRSPDGRSLVLLARENRHTARSMMSFSDDEGATWTSPVDAPWALTGDRHEGVLLPDGRYLVAFRDQAPGSPTRGQYMAWVGTFDDLRQGREGQYRIHLLLHHGLPGKFPGAPWDTGYSGVELLSDGTIVCTTYTRHFDDERQSSVVCTRFKIGETDRLAAGVMSPVGAAETAPALVRLTLGEVKPAGWLRDWCETAKNGYTRDMESVDIDYKLTLNPDYRPKTYYWQDLREPKTRKRIRGTGFYCAEAAAYWFGGLIRLAYQLDDQELKEIIHRRVDPYLKLLGPKTVGLAFWMDRTNPKEFAEASVWQFSAVPSFARASAQCQRVGGTASFTGRSSMRSACPRRMRTRRQIRRSAPTTGLIRRRPSHRRTSSARPCRRSGTGRLTHLCESRASRPPMARSSP